MFIPDPGVKKALDLGSGSATLVHVVKSFAFTFQFDVLDQKLNCTEIYVVYVKNEGFKLIFRFHVENKMAASFDTSSSDEDIGKTHGRDRIVFFLFCPKFS
jgi:hypothetical protein